MKKNKLMVSGAYVLGSGYVMDQICKSDMNPIAKILAWIPHAVLFYCAAKVFIDATDENSDKTEPTKTEES